MRRTETVLALAAVLLTGACSPAGEGATGSVVTIGAIYPTSGRQGPGGVEEANGARLAVELANQRGGLRGQPLQLELLDVDSGDEAAAAVERLRAKGIGVVLGTYGSTISAPVATSVHRSGMLLWETGAVGELGVQSGPGQSFFRMAPMGANLGRAAVGFVRDQLAPMLDERAAPRPLRYAVAYVDDAYGRAVGLGAADEARASGQELVGTFPYDVHTFDAEELVRAVTATAPDVLFVSAYLTDGVAIRRATVTQGLDLLASIGTSSSYCMPAFAAALGPAAVGLFASDKPDASQVRADALSASARSDLVWAQRRYRQLHKEDMTAAALSGFANAWALVGHVLPASPSLRPTDVAAAARTLKLPQGALPNGAGLDMAGPDARDAGENRAAVSVIWQWVDQRTQVVVWPPAFANQPPKAIPILP